MKTKFYLGLAACVLLMTNCSQVDSLNQDNYNTIISATIESAIKSRSTVTEGGEFTWAQNDEISVQKKNDGFTTFVYGNNNQFSLKTGETSSIWEGVAYYPANTNHTSTHFFLPATYSLGTNTLNTHAPMKAVVAESSAPNLSFRHLGGVLRFKFRNVPPKANKFVFTTNKGITGSFDITSSGNGEVIEAKEANSNNLITFDFTANQSSEMTFYVPMPVGTYQCMSVAFYQDATVLWETSSTATNEVKRASLLLMPPLYCTANSTTASSSTDVSNALNNQTQASVNLSGEAIEMTEISIPESFTSASSEESNLNLIYNTIPTGTITISDANDNAEQTETKGNVSISIPNVTDESEVPSFNINLPTMTVTLQANIENAVYNEVTVSTAKNTLRVGKGVTIKKLILNGGNIVIEEGAIVETIDNAVGYNATTYIVKMGALKNTPQLDNVIIVDSEDEIPSDEILDYELRVLTFEDKDAKFKPYCLDYVEDWSGKKITTWSDLIDNPPYSGPLTYGNNAADAEYYWYDEDNTELYHKFPDNYAYCFWGGGHAISNYWCAGYTDEDRNTIIAKYYGEDYVNQWAGKPGADAALGWFLLQYLIPIGAHSGQNFAVHYGYKDFYTYIVNLPEISFGDETVRVIDHMYVTNTNYTLNQLYNGVKSEEGNSFGGNWTGLTEDAWLKIVAQGYDSFDADPTRDEPTSTAEFYLVEGHNVVEDWQKWDLSGLGKVAKVRFNFEYSEEMGGTFGFTIPAYFAYDDVAVRFEK